MSFADKFNLLNEFNLLRIICALFFIPHIVAKFTVTQATLNIEVETHYESIVSHHRTQRPHRPVCQSITE